MVNNSVKALAIAAALGAAVQFSDGRNAIADGTQPQDISSAREAVKSHTEGALAGEIIKSIPGEIALNTKKTQEKLKSYAEELEKAKKQNTKENSSTAPQFENTNFDKYYSEIQENFGDDIANVFKENAEYFASIIKESSKEYMLGYLLAVFKNPGEESAYNRFIKKTNKVLLPGIEIDQNRLAKLNEILKKAGITLNQELARLDLALASQDEIIKAYELKIKEGENRLKELNKKIEANKKEIENLKQQIKERGGIVDSIKKKVG